MCLLYSYTLHMDKLHQRGSNTINISSRSSVRSTTSLPVIQTSTQSRKSKLYKTTKQSHYGNDSYARQLGTWQNDSKTERLPRQKHDGYGTTAESQATDRPGNISTPLSTGRAVPVVHWKKISSFPETERVDETFECDDTVDLRNCLNCGESSRILKLLPCLHSFCETCLEMKIQEHPNRSWFQCELCKRRIHIPDNGISGFEDNSYFKFSDLSISENEQCEICNDIHPTCKCSECNINLCSECVKSHLKVEMSKDHYIVHLTTEMVGKSSLETVCKDHSPFTLELFCITCSEPICGRCAIDKHVNHIAENIQVTVKSRRNELKILTNSTRRALKDMRVYINRCNKEKKSIQADARKTVNDIQTHIQSLKTELDEIGKKLVTDVLERESLAVATLGRNIDNVEINQRSIHASVETFKQIVERTRDMDLITRSNDLKSVISEVKKSSKPPPTQCARFKYKPLLQSLKMAMGRVHTDTFLKRPVYYVDVCSLDIQRGANTAIYPVDDNKAWIGFRKYIQLCGKDGSLGLRINMEESVAGIDGDSNESVIVACRESVKVVSNKCEPKFLFHLCHEPSDLKIDKNDNLIISFKDAKRVALFSTKGKVLHEFDVRNFGFRFGVRINDPWKLAINENQNIFLSDFASETIGVYDRYCEIKSAITSNVYRRASMCCDKGLLFVADYKRDCVQLYSEDGKLVQTCHTQGMTAPSSIAVDKTGDLWLGSSSGLVKVYSPK